MQVNFSINIDDKLLERIKGFFTKRNTIVIVLLFTVAITTLILHAQTTSLIKSYTFNNGETIFADRINKNFDDLFDKVNELDGKAGGTPIGTIVAYAGSIHPDRLPNGWLVCDGKGYDRYVYEDLFNKIRYDYGGTGNTFQVPDLRGRVVIGVINMGGSKPNLPNDPRSDINGFESAGDIGGKAKHDLISSELPHHRHEIISQFFDFNTDASGSGLARIDSASSTPNKLTIGYIGKELIGNDRLTAYAGGVENPTPISIMQPSIAFNYLIKY